MTGINVNVTCISDNIKRKHPVESMFYRGDRDIFLAWTFLMADLKVDPKCFISFETSS